MNEPGDRTVPMATRTALSSTTTGSGFPAGGDPDFSGTVIGGYQLVRMLAEGGMGVVYEAIQINLSRKVAVKILSRQLAARPEFLQRFQREAKAAAALNHPNMVQVHDFGEGSGHCYLVMEFVEGQNLDEYVEASGKLPVYDALNVIEQAAMALKAASDKAIIHRDIKPSNLMLTQDGLVKLADLGLAKIMTESSDLTITGVGMGSPYFMAPEQASDASDVDHRADIYSLGLTLLFLLTGRRPFEGNTPFSIVLAHANKPLPRGGDLGTKLPTEVEDLIQKMSAKDPAKRYQDYDALLLDLRRVQAGNAPRLDFAGFKRKAFTPVTVLIVGVVLALALGVGLALNARSKGKVNPASEASASVQNAKGSPQGFPRREDGPPNGRPMGGPPGGRFRGSAPDEFGQPAADEPEGPGPRDAELATPNSGGMTLPFGQLAPPVQNPLKDGSVSAMLAEADAYAAEHPQNFRDQVDRYRQVNSKAQGTPEAAAAETKLNAVISRHQEAIQKAMAEFQAKMEKKLKTDGPQAAYDVWKDFPPNLRTLQSDQQVQVILHKELPQGFVPK